MYFFKNNIHVQTYSYGISTFVKKGDYFSYNFQNQHYLPGGFLSTENVIKMKFPKKKLEQTYLDGEAYISTKTRPSSDSEAATIYKLKGKSSNMRTGQGFN